METLSSLTYLVSAVLFILALRGLSHPETARQGLNFGITGMAIAIITTMLLPSVGGWLWIVLGIGIGGAIGIPGAIAGTRLGGDQARTLTRSDLSPEEIASLSNKRAGQEINFLKDLKVIVALGKIAFDACKYFYKSNYNFNENIKFDHNKVFKLPNNILLIGCYHPSPRNVNTGRINEKKMVQLFKKVLELV